jgi:hypothetical protein
MQKIRMEIWRKEIHEEKYGKIMHYARWEESKQKV